MMQVFQGEREFVRDNKSRGNFALPGLMPAPRGIPQSEVTFDIDANGIVHVHAKDMATGKEQSMTVTGGSALGKDEIDRMVKEAEANAEADKKRREAVEMRNEADALAFRTEKLLDENFDKIPEDTKAPVTEAIATLKETLKGTDNDDEVKAAMDDLNQKASAMGQAIYAAVQQAQAENPQGQDAESASSESGDDTVVDAEIVDDEDEKK